VVGPSRECYSSYRESRGDRAIACAAPSGDGSGVRPVPWTRAGGTGWLDEPTRVRGRGQSDPLGDVLTHRFRSSGTCDTRPTPIGLTSVDPTRSDGFICHRPGWSGHAALRRRIGRTGRDDHSGPFFRGLPTRVMRLRQNMNWHFDNPRGLAGATRSRRDRVVPLGSSFGRDEASDTARTDFASCRSRRSCGLRVSPRWGIVAAGTKTGADPIGGTALDRAKTRGEAKRRRAAALPRGLASSGREGPVFPPEPRSRCRGREGREDCSICTGRCLEKGATGCQPEDNRPEAWRQPEANRAAWLGNQGPAFPPEPRSCCRGREG
jgi:hypothetical protein